MNKQDTTSKRASILAKLKTAGFAGFKICAGLVVVLCLAAIAYIAGVGMQGIRTRTLPTIVPAPAVHWVGNPVIAQERATGHLTNVEFGIREDGVVVWRDKRGPMVNGKRFGDFEAPADLFKPPGSLSR